MRYPAQPMSTHPSVPPCDHPSRHAGPSAGFLLLLATLSAALVGPFGPLAQARAADLNEAVGLVPAAYRHKLVQRLSLADDRQDQWLDAIVKAPAEHREAVAFLLLNMPERDLKGLTGDFLLRNVALAYEARKATPWAAAVPDEVFFNDVLPYANLNERRDEWRGDFLKRFGPQVAGCKTPGEAAQVLNKAVFKQLDVKYHATKRPKPDQSPYESAEAKFASCSGLSILLVDACRSVGVPARVVGTPRWADDSGNHTWAEVWDGKQWRFVGAAEPGPFDRTWFADLAKKSCPPTAAPGVAAKGDDVAVKPDDALAKAEAALNADHRVYAASFRQTGTAFPLVWDPACTDYPAVDVSAYYVSRRTLKVTVAGVDAAHPATVQVRQGGALLGQASGPTAADFELAAGGTYTVRAVLPDGRSAEAEAKLPRDAHAAVELRPMPR